MAGFGAVVSFDIERGAEPADGVCRAVRSSPCHEPGRRRVDLERRAVIPPGLLRLSVGCEHPDDLWRDLQQALKP